MNAELLRRVSALEAAGVAPEKARTEAARQLGVTWDAPAKDERVREKEEQVEIRKIAIGYGFKVRNLSQYRPSKVALGFADLFLSHKRLPVSLFWETKRQVGGERSGAQVEFGEDCMRTNVGYGYGDRYAFVDKLLELELAVRGAGQYGIEPVRSLTSIT